MQSAFKPRSKFGLNPITLACQLMLLGAASNAFAQSEPVATSQDDANHVTITAQKAGMGLMVREDAPKARSTITKEELQKLRGTDNAYQSMSLLPSVNSYNYDGTGLFGGGLTMRGFNSDQIGATINGVPINDSGNFAIYPTEFVDQENVCKEFVTQGSTDVDSPHVGATGGNIGIVTCDPEDKQRFRIAQTLGGWLPHPEVNPASALAEFAGARHVDRLITAGLTDLMPRIFSTGLAPVEHACGLALLGMDLASPLRAPLAQHLLQGFRA